MTWICCNCHESHSDEFNQCWNCGTDSNGIPSPDFAQYFEQLSDAEYDDLLLGQLPVPVLEPVPISLQTHVTDPPQQLPSTPSPPERLPPKPFQHRLNTYLHRNFDEPIPTNTFRSRMPFWIAEIQLVFTPTKTIEQIRRLLIRIRDSIHRSRKGT
jgi:hypothetical protein